MKGRETHFVTIVTCDSDAKAAGSLAVLIAGRTHSGLIVVSDRDYGIGKAVWVQTVIPASLNLAAARSWLKTKLPFILPKGPVYAYLDPDVKIISDHPDSIFRFHTGPFSFTAFPLKVSEASAFMVKCRCADYPLPLIYDAVRLRKTMSLVFPYGNRMPMHILEKRAKLEKLFRNVKMKPWKHIPVIFRSMIIRRLSAKRYFSFYDGFVYDRMDACWRDANGDIVMFHYPRHCKRIGKLTGLRLRRNSGKWYGAEGREIYPYYHCLEFSNHLRSQTGVKINDSSFQLWSPAFFTFSEGCEDFFEAWFQFFETVRPGQQWQHPSMAALTAAVWHCGVAHYPVLPRESVLYFDSRNADLSIAQGEGFLIRSEQKTMYPAFLVDAETDEFINVNGPSSQSLQHD